MNNKVVLLNRKLKMRGMAEKQRAHEGVGMLHLAFCVLIFNAAGELLLQQRAASKYHFAGLWSNSCCGHPRPGEDVRAAATRRLGEEFGFKTSLSEVASFVYVARDLASGMVEHEFAHVFIGRFSGKPKPDPNEIGAWRWQRLSQLRAQLRVSPSQFTPWFRCMAHQLLAAPYAKPHINARFSASSAGQRPRGTHGNIVRSRQSGESALRSVSARAFR